MQFHAAALGKICNQFSVATVRVHVSVCGTVCVSAYPLASSSLMSDTVSIAERIQAVTTIV